MLPDTGGILMVIGFFVIFLVGFLVLFTCAEHDTYVPQKPFTRRSSTSASMNEHSGLIDELHLHIYIEVIQC
jgi:uncharacterized membrane protein